MLVKQQCAYEIPGKAELPEACRGKRGESLAALCEQDTPDPQDCAWCLAQGLEEYRGGRKGAVLTRQLQLCQRDMCSV